MDYIATYMDGSKATTLSHYGIKKMQWGVRRYQNEDGTLTPEGRRRYLKRAENKPDLYKNLGVAIGTGVATGRTVGVVGGIAGGLGAAAGSYAAYKIAKHRHDKAVEIIKADNELRQKKYEESPEGQKYLASLKEQGKKLNAGGAKSFEKDSYKDSVESFKEARIHESDWAVDNGLTTPHDVQAYVKQALKNYNEHEVDHVIDQHMSEAMDMRDRGYISKETFAQLYSAQLNKDAFDYHNSWSLDELAYWHDLGRPGVKGQRWGVRQYQNPDGTLTPAGKARYTREKPEKSSGRYTTGSKSWVEEAANDPEHWELIDDTPGERLYKRRDPPKSSGRYKTGSKSGADTYKPNKDNWKEVSKGVYEPTEKLSKQPKGKYVSVIAKNGSRSMVRIDDKASAAVTLGFMGLSQSEIASKLGISEDQLKKELASYKSPVYNGGIGVGRISKK